MVTGEKRRPEKLSFNESLDYKKSASGCPRKCEFLSNSHEPSRNSAESKLPASISSAKFPNKQKETGV